MLHEEAYVTTRGVNGISGKVKKMSKLKFSVDKFKQTYLSKYKGRTHCAYCCIKSQERLKMLFVVNVLCSWLKVICG